jgi:hypothetical protein
LEDEKEQDGKDGHDHSIGDKQKKSYVTEKKGLHIHIYIYVDDEQGQKRAEKKSGNEGINEYFKEFHPRKNYHDSDKGSTQSRCLDYLLAKACHPTLELKDVKEWFMKLYMNTANGPRRY